MKKEMSLQKESEWDENIKESFLKELDFLSDHWVNGDDKPPFSFGGWREDVAYEFVAIVKYWVLQREKEIAEEVEKMKKYHREFECNGAFNGKGCYESWCEDQECRNAPKEYNQAITDVLQILKH